MNHLLDKRFRAITVRWDQIGFHQWTGAPKHRSYLADRHRHLFKFRVTMDVHHDDREVEFHDLLDETRAFTATWGTEFGSWSCEQMADMVVTFLVERYPGRTVTVTVSEDGETDATVSTTGPHT